MRNFFNNILSLIGQTSLTDLEFATCLASSPTLSQATYDDLARVLESRESISTAQERLVAFYKAGGVDVTAAETAKSNIFIGAVL